MPVKEFAIAHFGTHDKEALVTGIVVLLAAFAAGDRRAGDPRARLGLAGLAVFAARRRPAALSLPAATAADVVPTLVGAAVAAAALVSAGAARSGGPALGRGTVCGSPAGEGRWLERRRFLIAGAGRRCCAAGSGWAGALLGRFNVTAPRAEVRLPAGGGGRAGAGRDRRCGFRADPVLHLERQLLPGRHRPGAAGGVTGNLDAADRRHGRPARSSSASPSCCGCR